MEGEKDEKRGGSEGGEEESRGLTNASNDQSLNLGSCADVVVHPCQNWNEFQLHLHWRCQT